MDDYGLGHKDGREDAYKAVRDTLALPVSDAEKLRLIALQVAPVSTGKVAGK
jgi:hypothetical protein